MNPFPGIRAPRGPIALGIGLILALTAACGDDPLGPEALEGMYQLVQVNGDNLPALVLKREVGVELWSVFVTGGYLELKEAQSHSSSTVSELWIDGELDNEGEFTVSGSYSIAGDSITLVEGSHVLRGTFTRERIQVRSFESGFGWLIWTYER